MSQTLQISKNLFFFHKKLVILTKTHRLELVVFRNALLRNIHTETSVNQATYSFRITTVTHSWIQFAFLTQKNKHLNKKEYQKIVRKRFFICFILLCPYKTRRNQNCSNYKKIQLRSTKDTEVYFRPFHHLWRSFFTKIAND